MSFLFSMYKENTSAFWTAFIYVGVGTFSVCSIYPSDILYGNWSLWGVCITFPVSAISFIYRYAETENIIPVIFIQFIMFVLAFLAMKFIFNQNK